MRILLYPGDPSKPQFEKAASNRRSAADPLCPCTGHHLTEEATHGDEY